MKVRASYADFVTDWQQLLDAIAGTPELTDLRSKSLLEQALAEVKVLNAQQALHVAARQEATKAMVVALNKGKDLASHLRVEIKAQLGLRTEKLVQFRSMPIRSRTRRKKSPTEEPAAPSTAAVAKGAPPAAPVPDGASQPQG